MSLIGPIDLRHGAGPWLGYKDIAEPLSKASIERCIMGNDQSCTISKRRHLLGIDLSARDHLVGDAGNHGDRGRDRRGGFLKALIGVVDRSEEHTSELQSLMRISYAVFCLKTTN